jgi:hypothetical protein
MKALDILSPEIKLYYKDSIRHQNIYSAFLSLIVCILGLSISIYFTLELIERKSPKAFGVNKYIGNAGNFSLGPDQMFHYFYFNSLHDNRNLYDPKSIRISGILYDDIGSQIAKTEYGYCKYDIDSGRYTSLIEDKEFFEKSACIRQYTDLKSNVTYKRVKKEDYMPYPYLLEGMDSSSKQFVFYYIQLEICSNETSPVVCYPKEKLYSEIPDKFFYFGNYIDNNFDVTDYKSPIISSINKMSGRATSQSFITNYFNFQPVNLTTNDGLFFESFEIKESFKFVINDKMNTDRSEDNYNIIAAVYFMLKNNALYYDRSYPRIQDLLANIGGVLKALTMCASLINNVFSNFFFALHTYEFLENHIEPKKKTIFLTDKSAMVQLNHVNKSEKPAFKVVLTNSPFLKDEINKETQTKQEVNTNNFNAKILQKVTFSEVFKKMICFKNKNVDTLLEFRQCVLDERSLFTMKLDLYRLKSFLCQKFNGEWNDIKIDFIDLKKKLIV